MMNKMRKALKMKATAQKKIKTIKEIPKHSESGTEISTEQSKDKEHEAKEISKTILEVRKKLSKKKSKHKRHEECISVKKPTNDPDKKEKTDEHKDAKKVKAEEHQLYLDFIARQSNSWKNKRHGSGGESKKTCDLYRDESESLTGKERQEKGKDETPHSPKPVPYEDSPKVSKSVPAQPEDKTIDAKVTDMEIDEEELNTEIANFRGSASYSNFSISDGLINSNTCHNSTSLYFVVDTNVLIRDIDVLQELKISVVNGRECVVVVPYVALQEMDGLKKKASIGSACQTAIRWCNQHFESHHPRVQGQTYSNYRATLQNNKGGSADDHVRDCCLLMSQEGLDVCLLTNDINLRNKALMSNLSAASAKDLKNKLRERLPNYEDPLSRRSHTVSECEELQMNDVSLSEFKSDVGDAREQGSSCHQATPSSSVSKKHKYKSKQKDTCLLPPEDMILLGRITTSLHHTLSNILQDVMQVIYGDLWLNIIKHKPPWSLTELFSCWEKHWLATMIDRFPSDMKELLAEINNLLTSPYVNVQKLMSRVQHLYSHFESESYRKHILSVQDSSSDVVDMSEVSLTTPTCRTPPPDDSPVPPPQSSGEVNVEKMINQVGAHITHFVALVLTTFGIQHNLECLSNMNRDSLTPDDARTSAINLHKVLMSLGTGIMRCLSDRSSAALQELGHLLVNFWSEAHLPCPVLPFMECDLRHFMESPTSEQYLKCVLHELESLVQQLTPVLASH